MSPIDFHVLLSCIHNKYLMTGVEVWMDWHETGACGDGRGCMCVCVCVWVCIYVQRQTRERMNGNRVGKCVFVWKGCGNDPPVSRGRSRYSLFRSFAPTLHLWIINLESASQCRPVAHYKALCTAVSRKLSIKRHPFMRVKSSPGWEWQWGVDCECVCECVCIRGDGGMGSHQRDAEQTEDHPQPGNPYMTI